MIIKFKTENFKYDSDSSTYIGNPGLVSHDNGARRSDIISGIWLDIDGIYAETGDGTTYKNVSFHGTIPLQINPNNEYAMDGKTEISINGTLYDFGVAIKGDYSEDINGNPTGKIIRVGFSVISK